MYCNQCGSDIKDTAKFCKKCGTMVEDEIRETPDWERAAVKFFYTKRKQILIGLIILLIAASAAVVGVTLWQNNKAEELAVMGPEVVSVDLKDEYEMEDNELILDPLMAVYSDGTTGELKNYTVYIDTLVYEIVDGKINGKDLYDGMHLIRLEWEANDADFIYQKTVSIKHKVDTWEKYPDIPGKSGKEIAAAYGKLTAPEFGKLSAGDWGYAYVNLPSRNLRLTFPAGLFDNPADYGESDAGCIEMSGILSDLFYNMESEMTQDRLAEILEITLSQNADGGCSGTLNNGNQIFIGVGEVNDGLYMPTTTVRVSVSEAKRKEIFDYFF